jgi:hypothetical protein
MKAPLSPKEKGINIKGEDALKYVNLSNISNSTQLSSKSSLLNEDLNIIDAMRIKGMKLLHTMCYLVYCLMLTIISYTWLTNTDPTLTLLDKYGSTLAMSFICYIIQIATRRSHQTMRYTPLILMSFNFVLALERDVSLSQH